MKSIIALCAPTGDGKTTLIRAALDLCLEAIAPIRSTTTRPREDRDDDFSYEYITMSEFNRRHKAGRFVNVDRYGNNWYGYDRYNIEKVLAHGICAATQKGILDLQRASYTVMPIKIVAKGNEEAKEAFYRKNPQRKIDDEEREKIPIPYVLRTTNSFWPGGLEFAAQKLVNFILSLDKK